MSQQPLRLATGLGEPVAIVAAVQALLVLFCSFGQLDFIGLHTQGDVALLVVVLNCLAALYLAWSTHATVLAPLIELVKAALAFAVIYGFHITTEQTGMVIASITAIFAAFQRTQVTALTQGTFKLAA